MIRLLVLIFFCQLAYPKSLYKIFDKPNEVTGGKKQVKKGGKVTIGKIGSFSDFNAYFSKLVPASGTGNNAFASPNLLVDTLMRPHPINVHVLYPLIAKEYELGVNSITFTINKAAKWSDNKPITAQDVAYSIEMLQKYGHLYLQQRYWKIQKVEVLGSYKVKVTVKSGFGDKFFLHKIAQTPIFPKHYCFNKDPEKFDITKMPLSGPYRINKWQMGRFVEYKRRPDYWAKDLIVNQVIYNLDRIHYKYFRSQVALVQAIKRGVVDLHHIESPQKWDYWLREGDKYLFNQQVKNLPVDFYCFVFNTRKSKFSKLTARKKVSEILDMEKFNKLFLQGAGLPIKSFFLGNKAVLQLSRSQKAILDSLNQPIALDGAKTSMPKCINLLISNESNMDEKVANYFKKMTAKRGIKVNIIKTSKQLYWQKMFDHDFDMTIFKFKNYQVFDPYILESRFSDAHDPGSINFAGINNTALLRLCTILKTNPQLYKDVLSVIDYIIMKNFYFIPLIYLPKRYIIHKSNIIFPQNMEQLEYSPIYWEIKNNKCH